MAKALAASATSAYRPAILVHTVISAPWALDVALGRIKRQGYVKERSETRIALALEVYHSAANGDVDDSPNNEWSDRGLQVFDLKAAAALSCSYTIGTNHAGSHTITVARTCMNHAPSRGCCRAYLAVGE